MNKFKTFKSIAIPLIRNNIDTDAIIPKQYLKAVSRQGFGNFLFDDWRYKDPGDLDVEISKRKKNDDFILNKKDFEKAQIIISGENFGCGSSREHAVWALSDFGIKSVIAISFADIFYNNCFKNGLLPVILKKEEIEEIKTYIGSLSLIEINLENQLVKCADKSYEFEIDPSRKFNLINGIDDISKTLEYQNDIISYENKRKKNKPWLI
ncbi:MAG: 3-isopropylmalate dehydratase small subunit [Gammaproteobacteria bacterium]|jgi:3-isopropylmalate/(R)-2-methylmalate dehydratase small subunit|nr:3-isopropylmalate dehydratase small subunit [Gammaproteobacteria bacterium]MEC9190645.1 3-isopropylmalate dehydratase small subunit [Pseudomonadota bacterium]|tara:strand:- start:6875 stop:7501 length:627 start_codon:yes stop_codon:yes gene_type:complete